MICARCGKSLVRFARKDRDQERVMRGWGPKCARIEFAQPTKRVNVMPRRRNRKQDERQLAFSFG